MPGGPITAEDRADDYPRAVLFMLLAALFLPLLNAAVKYLSGRYPVLELLWARYAGKSRPSIHQPRPLSPMSVRA